MNRLCGRSNIPIHSIPCSVAQPVERGYKNYYSKCDLNHACYLLRKMTDEGRVIAIKKGKFS